MTHHRYTSFIDDYKDISSEDANFFVTKANDFLHRLQSSGYLETFFASHNIKKSNIDHNIDSPDIVSMRFTIQDIHDFVSMGMNLRAGRENIVPADPKLVDPKIRELLREDITGISCLPEYLNKRKQAYLNAVAKEDDILQTAESPEQRTFYKDHLGYPASLLVVTLYEELMSEYFGADYEKLYRE